MLLNDSFIWERTDARMNICSLGPGYKEGSFWSCRQVPDEENLLACGTEFRKKFCCLFCCFFHADKFHLAAWEIVVLDVDKKKGFFHNAYGASTVIFLAVYWFLKL